MQALEPSSVAAAEHEVLALMTTAVWKECDDAVQLTLLFQANAHRLVRDVWHRQRVLQNCIQDLEAHLPEETDEPVW